MTLTMTRVGVVLAGTCLDMRWRPSMISHQGLTQIGHGDNRERGDAGREHPHQLAGKPRPN
jgi:hypothetical protein